MGPLFLVRLIGLHLVILISSEATGLRYVNRLSQLRERVIDRRNSALSLLVVDRILLGGLSTVRRRVLRFSINARILATNRNSIVLADPVLCRTRLECGRN